MKLKYFLYTAITILCCVMSACSSSDDELEKIVFPKDQPTSIIVPANQNSDVIRFTASAAWSAWTSTESRGVNDVEWIHLETTNGSAGESYLNFTLEYNNSDETRTAYIIITCEDTRIVVTITQTTEDDPDVPNTIGSGVVEIEVNRYEESSGQGYTFDGTTNYELHYESIYPTGMIARWRDDMDSYLGAPSDHDSYCLNIETTTFNWGNSPVGASEVMVNMINEMTYYPSERKESESSQHFAEIKDGKVIKGWYRWDEDYNQSNWEASYDKNGYLISSKNDDGDIPQVWDTHTLTWEDGNLKKIVCTNDRVITITHADPSLRNLHSSFDLNWVLPTELECYDFAAGDITKVFASTGLMGKTSNLLITAIEEYDGKDTYSYRMNFKENTKDRTVVTVMHLVNDVQTSYSEWTIKYTNIK